VIWRPFINKFEIFFDIGISEIGFPGIPHCEKMVSQQIQDTSN
jgi:hypothetical protein